MRGRLGKEAICHSQTSTQPEMYSLLVVSIISELVGTCLESTAQGPSGYNSHRQRNRGVTAHSDFPLEFHTSN